MSILVSIDFGKEGALAVFENGSLDDVIDVPRKTIITKPATYKYKHKDPKIVIKSGKNAGKRQKVIETSKKTKALIDFDVLLASLIDVSPDYIVVEKSAFMRVNKGTLTKLENHGILKGLIISMGCEFEEVGANAWKKKLGVTSDKDTSMRLAHKLFEGWEFERDDQAEAALIGFWYLNK